MRRTALRMVVVLGTAVAIATPALAAPATLPGAEMWASQYAGPDGPAAVNESAAMALSPDGAVAFVAGISSAGEGVTEYATVAFDSTSGAELWDARYDGGEGRNELADVAVSPDASTVFVTGQSSRPDAGLDLATVAYDAADGTELWTATHSGEAGRDDYARAVAVSPDGETVYVTGQVMREVRIVQDEFGRDEEVLDDDFVTIAYDASTGAERWFTLYDGTGLLWDGAYDVLPSHDGSLVYVTGRSWGETVQEGEEGEEVRVPTEFDYATIAYNSANGSEVWVTRFNNKRQNQVDEATHMALSPDGSALYVTGRSYGGTSQFMDYTTVAYDAATGADLWPSSALDLPHHRYHNLARDEPAGITVSPDGATVYLTGLSGGNRSSDDYATVAIKAVDGKQAWVARYDGPPRLWDNAEDVAVSPDGSRLFVTGYSWGVGSGGDFTTIAYDAANGTQLALARYNGPANGDDWASAMALSPDGSQLFVAGIVGGAGYNDLTRIGSSELGIVAYGAGACPSGEDPEGAVSGPLHKDVEPVAGPAAPVVRTVACELSAQGL